MTGDSPLPRVRRRLMWGAILIAGALGLLPACAPKKSPTRTIRIAVNQYVEHPNLDALRTEFMAVVGACARARGDSVHYTVANAGANANTALQIAEQQAASKPDLILALATPSAQAAVKASGTVPVVFGAITDPIAAHLVDSWNHPGGNASGSSDLGPYAEQFRAIIGLLPRAHVVGVIRNPGESNSVAAMVIIDKAIVSNGLVKREAAVSSTSEVPLAARAIVDRCDFLFIPPDNTVLSALPPVAKLASTHRRPLFVTDEGSVKLGAAGTLGIDYRELGRATGEIACQVLNGTHPGEIPVRTVSASRWVINRVAADAQGVVFPDSLLKNATFVDTQ